MPDDLNSVLLERIRGQIASWQDAGDGRAVFLDCYLKMTENTLQAIAAQQFEDNRWVERLLHHFASYYFDALDAYEAGREDTPAVWKQTHDAARRRRVQVLHNLLLGVNAHINHDLVLALVDLLEGEWPSLSAEMRARRRLDHDHINVIIAGTTDSVQSDILQPQQPLLGVVDDLLGPLDEFKISVLITHWRSDVWRNAQRMLAVTDAAARAERRAQLEQLTLMRGRLILLQ